MAAHSSRPVISRPMRVLHEIWRSRLAVAGAILLGVLWLGAWRHHESQFQTEVAAAKRDQMNLARAFGEHVNDSIRSVDRLLRAARKVHASDSFTKLAESLQSENSSGEFLTQLTVIDSNGVIRNSAPIPNGRIDFSGRDHFGFHVGAFSDRLHVGHPIPGATSGQTTIPFTRRVLGELDEIEAVVLASVRPTHFSNFYSTFELGRQRVNLMDSDGVILASGSGDGDNAGRTHPLKDKLIAAANRDCFISNSPKDAQLRIYCSRAVAGAPLYVTISQPLEDLTLNDDFKQQDLLIGIIVSLVCAALMAESVIRRRRLDNAIAEAEAARVAASNSARELRYTLENMRQGVMLIDADGRIRVWNEPAFALLGLDQPARAESVTNEDLRQMLGRQRVETSFPELRPLSEALDLAERDDVYCAGSNGRIIKIRTSRTRDSFVRMIEDITQPYLSEKAREVAQQREHATSRTRSSFVTRISHEIRTPLHAAIGFSRLLTRERLPERAQQLASEIYASTSHLIAIIDDVLDFSSLDSGHLQLNKTTFDVREIVDRVATMSRVLASDKSLDVVWRVAPGVPSALLGDPVRIQQILTNLVSNAVKFTDSGEVRLKVDAAGRHVVMQVSDTGCGISDSDMPHIFAPFARARSSAGKPGTGLGLAIVRDLVDLMGGAIEVKSEPGKGTTFSVSIPFESAEVAAAFETAPLGATSSDARKLRVLVADDTRSSLRLIRLMLEARGHAVTAVCNGREAVDAFAAQAFDLVFLDLQMPVMDGIAAGEIISARRAHESPATLISALSAQVSPAHMDRARGAGIDVFLRKPFEEADLDNILASATERANAREIAAA